MSLRGAMGRFTADRRGVAAIEFALFGSMLSVAMLNTADVAIYIFDKMELENATEAGAQAAWKACDLSSLPATTNCSGLTQAVTQAIQSTSLGTRVNLQSGSPSEGYYCVNAQNSLQMVSNVSRKPADCSAAGMANLQPADYIQIQTTYSYSAIAPGLTVAGTFPKTITKIALMRLG